MLLGCGVCGLTKIGDTKGAERRGETLLAMYLLTELPFDMVV